MWSRDNVPRPHQELLTPDDGAVTRLRLSSLGGRGRCSSRISLGHSCGLIANIDDLEWIVFWLSTTLSWLKLLRLNEWNDWWGCLCLQSKTKTFDKTDDTDFIQTRIYETEYLISVSTTPTFLQWSPNIDWLSTVIDPSVCLSGCQCCLCLQLTELQCLSPPPAVTLGCSTGLVWLSMAMARVLTRCGGGRRPDHGAERSH